MSPRLRWGLRFGLGLVAGFLLAAAAGTWAALRASLPRLEGEVMLSGLAAPAHIERDGAGVPVIRGATRADVARATGYAHAQDRYFQMDLLRRTAAGELAELLGPGLLDIDRRIRLHQFRKRALQALSSLDPRQRELLDAYVAGVNAALADSSFRPFEYLLLRTGPATWRTEDCLLVVYAMWIDLQGIEARGEQQRDRLAAALPETLYRLVTEPDPDWEAPLDGSRLPRPPLPDPQQVDLRRIDRDLFDTATAFRRPPVRLPLADPDPDVMAGSNNWAIAGARTASGRALVANDMHLGLRVPNIWYRARLVVEPAQLDISGVSLPGVPVIIAGSNGHVAWGFTNSYGDFQDLVVLEPGPGGTGYLTAQGERDFEVDVERLKVAGADAEVLQVRRTIWGPVIGRDAQGRELALAWTAHRSEANDMALLAMEQAHSLDEAAAIIGGAGMPAQNVVIGDAAGRIGWVLSGRLPQRHGFDPTRPAGWYEDGTGWQGWVAAGDTPRWLDPPEGRAWSANARVIGGEMFALIGDGGYPSASRARQIRDRLAPLQRATAADLLAIQLDDQADYLAHWQPILRRALAAAGAGQAEALVSAWSGHAATDDAGYRLLREFARRVSERAFAMLTVEARTRWPDFPWRTPDRFTEVAWRLIRERPAHLLDPRFRHWDAWLADVATEVVRELPQDCADLASCYWGRVNKARIQHPLSQALPVLARWLDMPTEPLPGDWSTPRVQSPVFGASERFVVSPGLEREGYLHMPGGQSGHPLSPFYRAGHEAWVRGEPTPFLPGPARYTLKLIPEPR